MSLAQESYYDEEGEEGESQYTEDEGESQYSGEEGESQYTEEYDEEVRLNEWGERQRLVCPAWFSHELPVVHSQ